MFKSDSFAKPHKLKANFPQDWVSCKNRILHTALCHLNILHRCKSHCRLLLLLLHAGPPDGRNIVPAAYDNSNRSTHNGLDSIIKRESHKCCIETSGQNCYECGLLKCINHNHYNNEQRVECEAVQSQAPSY